MSELVAGQAVRVRRGLGKTVEAVVVRFDDTSARVRFVKSGKERTVERHRLIGERRSDPTRELSRVPRVGASVGVPVPKPPPPVRSEAHLAHVRGLRCCICSKPPPSDPHHFGPRGMGQKTDDRRTSPLCRACHDAWHTMGECPPYTRAETERELYRAQVDALLALDPRIG